MTERILPSPPSSRSGGQKPSAESDFWAELFLDLTVRVEWLSQALEAVPTEDASAESLVRLRGYAKGLEELHQALGRVQEQRAIPEMKPLFLLEGPIAAFLSRLYGWCDEIGTDFERMAVALRRRQPTSIVFEHVAVNRSYAHFDAIFTAMRRANDAARSSSPAGDKDKRRELEERLEELIWATEWVHMALARPPGQ